MSWGDRINIDQHDNGPVSSPVLEFFKANAPNYIKRLAEDTYDKTHARELQEAAEPLIRALSLEIK